MLPDLGNVHIGIMKQPTYLSLHNDLFSNNLSHSASDRSSTSTRPIPLHVPPVPGSQQTPPQWLDSSLQGLYSLKNLTRNSHARHSGRTAVSRLECPDHNSLRNHTCQQKAALYVLDDGKRPYTAFIFRKSRQHGE